MRLGIIADTHGWLDPAIEQYFEGAALILLAGDIGSLAVVEGLQRIAPVYAVRGNNDDQGECRDLPDRLLVEVAGFRIGLSHYERQAILKSDIAVFGHSHRMVWDPAGSVIRLNPGAAGRRGFHRRRSVAVLDLAAGTSPVATHIDLGPRAYGDPALKPLC